MSCRSLLLVLILRSRNFWRSTRSTFCFSRLHGTGRQGTARHGGDGQGMVIKWGLHGDYYRRILNVSMSTSMIWEGSICITAYLPTMLPSLVSTCSFVWNMNALPTPLKRGTPSATVSILDEVLRVMVTSLSMAF